MLQKKFLKVFLLIALSVGLSVWCIIYIQGCAKKNAVGPDNANLPEVNLPKEFNVRAPGSRLPESNEEETYPYKEWVGISADSVNALGRAAMVADLTTNKPLTLSKTLGFQLYVGVPFYSQKDIHWASYPLGFNTCGNSTIGQYGCYLCSICMGYARWGTYVNPPTLNDWKYGGREHYAFAAPTKYDCGDLIRIPQALQYPGMCRNYKWIGANEIYGQLQLGRPVILSINGGAHHVVIFAFDGVRYWVKDPIKDAASQDQPLYGSFTEAFVFGY